MWLNEKLNEPPPLTGEARFCLIMQNNVGQRRHTGPGCDGLAPGSSHT